MRVSSLWFLAIATGVALLELGCRERSTGSAAHDEERQKLGIKECDDFLERYERCVLKSGRVPSLATPLDEIDGLRRKYRREAQTPGRRQKLAEKCLADQAEMREFREAWECEW